MGAIGRLTVAIVLVQLARGDAVAAEKAYKVSYQHNLKSLGEFQVHCRPIGDSN